MFLTLLLAACAPEAINIEWRSETLDACDANDYLHWTPPADERVVMAALRVSYEGGAVSYAQGVVVGSDGVMSTPCGSTPIAEAVVTYAVEVESE